MFDVFSFNNIANYDLKLICRVMCPKSNIFLEKCTEDEKHKTGPDRLLKFFTELANYYMSNPMNALARMKTQDKPVNFVQVLKFLHDPCPQFRNVISSSCYQPQLQRVSHIWAS